MGMVRVMKAEDSLSVLREACKKPEKFLQGLEKKTVGNVGKQWVIAQLRQHITPFLPIGLPYDDIWHVLEGIESLRELRTFKEAPKHCVWKLSNDRKWEPAVQFIAVGLRPELEPKLPEGVQWPDFLRVLEQLDPLTELEDTVGDWMKFQQKMELEVTWPPAKYWAIAQLRPVIEAQLKEW